MKFWEWFKKYSTPKQDEEQEAFSQASCEPDIIAELDLIDRQYILKEVFVDLCQDANTDEQSDYPGVMLVKTEDAADDRIIDWSTGPKRLRDGAVHFYSCRNSLKDGMVFSIAFTDARCISMEEKIIQGKKGIAHLTEICFSPRSILIGNERKTNTWK